jgi:hypothetical protein
VDKKEADHRNADNDIDGVPESFEQELQHELLSWNRLEAEHRKLNIQPLPDYEDILNRFFT